MSDPIGDRVKLKRNSLSTRLLRGGTGAEEWVLGQDRIGQTDHPQCFDVFARRPVGFPRLKGNQSLRKSLKKRNSPKHGMPKCTKVRQQ